MLTYMIGSRAEWGTLTPEDFEGPEPEQHCPRCAEAAVLEQAAYAREVKRLENLWEGDFSDDR